MKKLLLFLVLTISTFLASTQEIINPLFIGVIFNILFTINFINIKKEKYYILINFLSIHMLIILLPKDYLLSLICLKIIMFISNTNIIREIEKYIKKYINY